MVQPKGPKNKDDTRAEVAAKIQKTTGYEVKVVRPKTMEEEEVFVEDVPKVLDGWDLYDALRAKGFPQGGVGNWMYNEFGTDKVYVPHPSEIYNQYIADPGDWELMTIAMSRVWLNIRTTEA